MHRKYIILILGSVLVVAGLFTVASYSSTETQLQEKNTLIESRVIQPSESQSAARLVEAGQNMQLLVHYPYGISVNAKIKDPDGEIVRDVNSTAYTNELATTFTPDNSGKYTVTITNTGAESAPVHVVFGSIKTQN